MILETEFELFHTYQQIARLCHLAEKMKGEMRENDELKDAEVEGVYAMIRKMERQVEAFYKANPERLALPRPTFEPTLREQYDAVYNQEDSRLDPLFAEIQVRTLEQDDLRQKAIHDAELENADKRLHDDTQ